MVATTLLNGVLGFAALMAILFCAGDIKKDLESPTGFPFIEIFHQATNSPGGATAMTCVILALVFFATIGLIATASRMTWAFARDYGLPGSHWLAKVLPSRSSFECFFHEGHADRLTAIGGTSLRFTIVFDWCDCPHQSTPGSY